MFDGFWYRCEVKHYSIADEWGDHSYTSTQVVWSKFAVIAETPKGVWLTPCYMSKADPDFCRGRKGERVSPDILVLGKSKKQHACPTKEAALADAIVRKQRHIWGCQARLHSAREDFRHLNSEQHRLDYQAAKDAA